MNFVYGMRMQHHPYVSPCWRHSSARATSAAPSYFPAKFIRGLGFVQDGGAGKYNNPIDPAEWESRAIWGISPDIIVSIGTGYTRAPDLPCSVSERLRFRDRFLPRLFRLFSAVLNAQVNWNNHLNRVNEEERNSRYFRINIPLDDELELDDVERIPDLHDQAKIFLETYSFVSVAQALFSTAFFFELRQKPIIVRDSFLCYGFIRCRSPNPRALVTRILREYPTASFLVDDRSNIGRFDHHNLCMGCNQFCKEVAFTICHPNQKISIYLEFNSLGRHCISGFPQNISSIIKNQMLDANFGRPDHQVVDYAKVQRCQCIPQNKRKRRLNAGYATFKRKRV